MHLQYLIKAGCHNKAINAVEESGKNKGGWCQGGENRWRHRSGSKPECITPLEIYTCSKPGYLDLKYTECKQKYTRA